MERATPARIGLAIGRVVPSARVQVVGAARVWLTEQDEPFCEVDLHDDGAAVTVRYSVHCSPAWAGICTAALYPLAGRVAVLPEVFIQDHRGQVHYGASAEAYWSNYRQLRPLLTARFTAQDPYI